MTAALTIHRRMQRFGIWFAWAPCAVSARQLLNLEAWSSTHCHVLQSWNFQERAQMTKQTATRIKGNIRRFVIGESTLLGCVQTNVITVSEKISPRASLWPRGLDADRVIVKFPVWFWVWTFVACPPSSIYPCVLSVSTLSLSMKDKVPKNSKEEVE